MTFLLLYVQGILRKEDIYKRKKSETRAKERNGERQGAKGSSRQEEISGH